MAAFGMLAATLVVLPTTAAKAESETAPVADSVSKRLDEKGTSDYWVVMDASADLSAAKSAENWVEQGQTVVDRLQSTAKKSQRPVRKVLRDMGVDFQPFWISNRILVSGADEALTRKLTDLPGVRGIAPTRTVDYAPPEKEKLKDSVQAVEWNISRIQADRVWDQFGVRGEGITIANIDTGVQFDHPALVDSYRGNVGNGEFDHNYNWFDPSQICDTQEPCDWAGHGSHTMGTMLGGDGGENQIGVAPDANWIAAMGCDVPPNGCSDAALLASGQWTLAPTDLNGENPRVDKRPHVVNNSWGGANGSAVDPWYDDILQAWNAAGIFAVFSNGNDGANCDTTGSPADSPYAYGVGAFNEAGDIWSGSSRGPGADGEVRPDVAAPGVAVRSSVPDGEYGLLTGTSMAAPHVSGTVALLWAAAPALVGDIEATRELLDTTAVDTADDSCGGTAGNNNVWGEGKLDAFAAVEQAPRSGAGTLAGTVESGGSPVANATVTASAGDDERTATADENGEFSLTLAIGDYEVRVEAYGYEQAQQQVTIANGETTRVSFDLEAASSHAVEGQVTDARGQPVGGVRVRIPDTPHVDTTGAGGGFAFAFVPEGSYEVLAEATGCHESARADLVVDGAEEVALELQSSTDAYGNTCTVTGSQYREGDTELDLSGDDNTAEVEFPFPVWMYGQPYDRGFVATNGHVNLAGNGTAYSNDSIPSQGEPNAAVYPFWDDLVLDENAAAYTGVFGEAPNRTFVVEWRNAGLYSGDGRVDFQVQFSEQGGVTLAYRNLQAEDANERGGSATVGIENTDGTDAFEFSYNQPVLAGDRSIRFTAPPGGLLSGTVTDANDGEPVSGVQVTVHEGGEQVTSARTNADGAYEFALAPGDYTVRAGSGAYAESSTDVTVTDREIAEADFSLDTGIAEIETSGLDVLLPQGESRTGTVTLTNTGSAPLSFDIAETGGQQVAEQVTPKSRIEKRAVQKKPNARTTRAQYTDAQEKAARKAAKETPLAEGDVLREFDSGLAPAWGVGFDGDVWLSDPNAVTNTEFDTRGDRTGRQHDASAWAGDWNGDMAYDRRRDAVCQVNVGGDNGIHCWDPETGEVRYSLTGTPWSNVSQRGLAYDPGEDVFYVGGWNEDVVYRVAGTSAENPGATLNSCELPGSGLAGLAYNPTADVLWVTTNSPNNPILRIDPQTCELLGQLGFPEDSEFAGAGLALDQVGNLWVTSQTSNTAYLIESGVPKSSDVPWVSSTPQSGEVAPGESVEIEVAVDTTDMAAGEYLASLLVQTNAGRQPVVQTPVDLVVSGYWVGVDAGSEESWKDAEGYAWVADQEYESGEYGWVSEYRTQVRSRPQAQILGTPDDHLYRDFRSWIQQYRFDDLPAGTYEVTLDFAELQRSPRVDWRKFDVDINGDWKLVAHDVAAEVGGRQADRHTFQVQIDEDGDDLAVNFHARRGYEPPMVSAVRIVHRPDLG